MILNKETFDSLGKTFDEANQKDQIICRCDYCGGIFSRLKHNIIRSWKVIQSDSCSGKVCVQKKRVASNNKIFGTDNSFQNQKVKEKISETNVQKYGVKNPMQSEKVREVHKKSCVEKYGVSNPFANKQIKENIRQKNIEKYGVENVMQDNFIKEKQHQTMKERYGEKHALKLPKMRQKALETCIRNNGVFPVNYYGKTQIEIQEWLNSLGFNFQSNRSLFPGYEIDLYDSSKNFAIEYCGLHWHHELSLEPRLAPYHWNKYKSCLEQGVHLLTIFSDEWKIRNNQCKSHIKSLLGVCERRIFARKCKIHEIGSDIGREFIEEYHIQGSNRLGFLFFGLFYLDELVGVISLGRHHRQYKVTVLDRLCFKSGISVVGGSSRLFSRCLDWAVENNCNEIISFSDNRWSLGKVYSAMDFVLEKEYRPDYSYVEVARPEKRISKQSQKKKVVNCPEHMTEYEWAAERGLARIWDCGKKKWKKVV